MRSLLIILAAAASILSCNQNVSNNPAPVTSDSFQSTKTGGRWSTDLATAQELKGMHYTIENFTLLNRKKFENLKAYQEFGVLLQMHIDRTTAHCQLDPDTRNLLCKELDKLKAEIQTLQGTDMEKSKQAIGNINHILAGIDSSFSYMN